MVPLNSDDRRSSFFLFLMFFIISTVLVAITAFYGMEVPTAENKIMNDKILVYQKNQAFSEMFAAKAAQVSGDLDNINNPKVDAENMDVIIGHTLDSLDYQVVADTSTRSKMFKNIIQNLRNLDKAKKQLRDYANSNKSMAELEEKLRQANADLVQCQGAINMTKK